MSERVDAAGYYDFDPKSFADRYDSVTFEAVHPHLRRYLPANGRVLDVGAGSGRDARFMAACGLHVTAVEPSAGLRAIGARNSEDVEWIDDRLPNLACISDKVERFDFILCSAVLMLVAPEDLEGCFATLSHLLAPAGKLAMNLRAPRLDEPPDLFFAHSDNAVLTAAAATGLICLHRAEAEDALGRRAYNWRSFVFERAR